MTIIKGYTQLLAREESAEERGEYTGSILTQITHLDTMMREVLAFARGERRLFLQKIHLHGFFDEVTETLGSEFSQRAVNLELHLDYRNEISIDVDKMRRVLFNLAHNAADAMPDGGIFRIHVSREDDTVILTFSDTGNGIPESIQADLFDPFVTSGKKDGTGLGLAIAQQIVEQHEGTIGFETTAGEGTTFTIRLPVAGPSITEEDAGTHA
jgi:signal transduction histidine kinase